MVPIIEKHRDEIIRLCQRYGIARLELFGSYAKGTEVPGKSDIDFAIEFTPAARLKAATNFFGFKEELENLLGLQADFLFLSALRNPVMIEELKATAKPIYEAEGQKVAV
jgi:uncharacterized protein